VCLPFVESDVSTVIWILEFYDLDSESQKVISGMEQVSSIKEEDEWVEE
jgi:hypothetical protein